MNIINKAIKYFSIKGSSLNTDILKDAEIKKDEEILKEYNTKLEEFIKNAIGREPSNKRELIEIIMTIQKETEIDMGVCKCLIYDKNDNSFQCKKNGFIDISSVENCLPIERLYCKHRPGDYWEKETI